MALSSIFQETSEGKTVGMAIGYHQGSDHCPTMNPKRLKIISGRELISPSEG
jgi:hypothetical protein